MRVGGWSFQGWLGIGGFLGSDSGAVSGIGGISISGIGGIPQPDSRASSRISVISSLVLGSNQVFFLGPSLRSSQVQGVFL